MRGSNGPYYRLEEKRWDPRTKKLQTRQIGYYGKIENVPPEILERYGKLPSSGHDQGENSTKRVSEHVAPTAKAQNASQGKKDGDGEIMEIEKCSVTHVKDKEFIHSLIVKHYGLDSRRVVK